MGRVTAGWGAAVGRRAGGAGAGDPGVGHGESDGPVGPDHDG